MVIDGRAIASLDYWEQNARWYRLWVEHGNYHEPILHHLLKHIQPHWRVLDIGAGNGTLSLPLAAIGCEVTALEPSSAMRRLFFREAWRRGIGHVRVDERSWSYISSCDYSRCDLVIACNSLHVCEEGMIDAFRRVLAMRPRNIFVVTETGGDVLQTCADTGGYALCWSNEYEMQSPHVYHSLAEAFEHWRFASQTGARHFDEHAFASRLRISQGHWYLDENVNVSLHWWKDSENE
ncbi:MAG: hypothetical protein FD164_1883 [Nitrospirae bacterium]|nr:MAG: hypothetical protein FD164_1883 [Nitrospirota bacterium]